MKSSSQRHAAAGPLPVSAVPSASRLTVSSRPASAASGRRSPSPMSTDRRDISAIEKSARAAGMNVGTAEQYALHLLNKAQSALPDSGGLVALSTDDFRIGDRVWVGGSKPGIIVYIGEVHFGAGEWAGIVLDSPTGKNDGTVNGRRYFMCEPKRGVFSRLNKLTRSPVTGTASLGLLRNDSANELASVGAASLPPPIGARPLTAAARNAGPTAVMESKSLTLDLERRADINASSSPRGSGSLTSNENAKHILSNTLSSHGSGSSSPHLAPRGSGSASPRRASIESNHSTHNLSTTMNVALPSALVNNATLSADDNSAANDMLMFNVGDRVIVNKHKVGTIRFVGTTDFSSGLWAGVALDEPVGKNDGCVAGTRYFNCKPMHGLFTPTHKLTLFVVSTQPLIRNGTDSTTMTHSLLPYQIQPNDLRQALQPSAVNQFPTAPASYQKLKTTDERRDVRQGFFNQQTNGSNTLEMGEQAAVVQLANVSNSTAESDEITRRLKQFIEKLEKDNTELHHLLHDEKRKVEDLQFSLEESNIEKSDIETEFEKRLAQVHELEEKLRKEKELTDRLSHELSASKTTPNNGNISGLKTVSADQTEDYLDQIEELTHKLSLAESKVKALETNKQPSTVEKQLNDAKDDKSKMTVEIDKLTSEINRLVSDRDKTADELSATQKKLIEAELLMTEFKDTVDQIEQAHKLQTTEYRSHIEQLTTDMESLLQAQKQLGPYQEQVDKLLTKVNELSSERESLKQQVETLQSALSGHHKLENEHAACQANIQQLHNKFGQMVKEFEFEKNKLVGVVETAKGSLLQKEKQIEELRDEISKLKQTEQANAVRLITEQDSKLLQQKVSQLERSLAEERVSAKVALPGEDQPLSKLVAEKEEALSKIDFLNSVIVEIQGKNVELEAWKRRHELSAAGSGSGGHLASITMPLQRLYCDICNIYDQHDTEDCPQQGM